MADNLYPLIYKPGIKEDGTLFQSEYCTNGFWVRFQNGMTKKIGGMKSLPFSLPLNNVTALYISPNNDELFGYAAYRNNIVTYKVSNDFQAGEEGETIVANQNSVRWQIERTIDPTDQTVFLAFFASNNLTNIFDNSQAKLFKIRPFTDNGSDPIGYINPLANGGIVYAEPYLFIYGSNGFVQYSAKNDPFDFNPNNQNIAAAIRSSHFSILPGDKIIYGAQIRGGTYTPSILFWTLSALVLVRNVGDETPLFKPEKISDISIMSSKSVVEDSGVFYWIGTDDFYVFTGVVNRIPNPLNKRYFFDNIDMNKRQMVFGVKNERREIWWYYPEKANRGDPTIGCTRAIIYNIPENTWFDTPIERDAGFFSKELGFTITYGKPIAGIDTDSNVWVHEVGVQQTRWDSDSNNFVSEDIISSFTTPTFSWTAFNPLKQATGTDKWVILKRVEPDFKSSQTYTMQLTVNTKKYPQSVTQNYGPYEFHNNTEKIDLNVQGRNINLTFSSANDFEMGHILMLLGVGDKQ